MEDYLSDLKEKRNRFIFTRLSCSAHHLQIERGRYNVPKTPVEERLCKYCNLNEIKYEYHLIRKCSLHENVRIAFDQELSNLDNIIYGRHVHVYLHHESQ